MHAVFVLFLKSVTLFRANKAAMVITFLVPVVLIYIFGHVFGLHPKRKDTPASGIPVAVVNQSEEPAAVDLVAALKAESAFKVISEIQDSAGQTRPLTEADAREAILNNTYRFAVILPRDLLPEDRIGLNVRILSDPRNEIETQMVNGLLQKTVFTQVPQLLGQSLKRRAQSLTGTEGLTRFNGEMAETIGKYFDVDPAAIEQSLQRGDFGLGGSSANEPGSSAASMLGEMVKIESEQLVGRDVANPMAARTVGGYAIMFLLFALSGSAASLFEEKRAGLFQRLLSAPIRPAQILWGRFLFGIALGTVQLLFLFIAGSLLYDLNLTGHAGALIVMTLAAAAACTAFGMLIAAIAPTEEAASGLATLLVLTMSSIGGAWFPVSIMPEFIQFFSKLTLVYWAVEGFTGILWAGQSLVQVLPKVGILLAIAAVVMGVATWAFHRRRMFE